MPATVTPTADDICTAVSAFIQNQLGLDTAHVVQGYGNRVSMPSGPFVLMTPIAKKRLGTNHLSWDEADPDPSTVQYLQPQQMTIQLDCYGPAASEWSDILSTLLRSEVGCDALAPTCQ